MKIVEKINSKIGFTKNELKVVLFLAAAFIIGGGIKIYDKGFTKSEHVFNYEKSDSIFKHKSEYSTTNLSIIPDSQKKESQSAKKKSLPNSKSININKANKSELMRLPGIGEVTAERIITYRETVRSFKTYDDLLKVKGIGKKKLEQIKPYIIFE